MALLTQGNKSTVSTPWNVSSPFWGAVVVTSSQMALRVVGTFKVHCDCKMILAASCIPKKKKEGLIIWALFLLAWEGGGGGGGGALMHKECHHCILHLRLKLSNSSVCCTVCFTKCQEGHKLFWDSWKECVCPIQFIIWSLTSCTYHSMFCDLIWALKLESDPAPFETKSHWEHQTLYLICVGALGKRLLGSFLSGC